MDILVEDIPLGGLEWTEVMPSDWVGSHLLSQYHANGNTVSVRISLNRADHNVVMKAKIEGDVFFDCGRCAEETHHSVTHEFTRVFITKKNDIALPEDFDDPGSAEFSEFDGVMLHLEPVIAEEFVLSLPLYPVCDDACRGLCPKCGANLNQGPCGCGNDESDPRLAPLLDLLER